MRTVLFFLGALSLMTFTGLLAQSIMQSSANSMATVPVAGNVASVSESDTTLLPGNAPSDGDNDSRDEEKAMNSSENSSPQPSSSTVVGTTLFEYGDDEPVWYSVNDDVMGGVSTSMVSTDAATQRLTFSGNLSLENNGGFASIRSQWSDYDLTGYDGVVLRVRGDGQVYQFRIRTEVTGSEIAYAALFRTEAGTWKDIYIPFSEMVPIYRGVVVNSAPTLDSSSIRSFGFMLANKQAGDFLLEVDMISAVAASNQQV